MYFEVNNISNETTLDGAHVDGGERVLARGVFHRRRCNRRVRRGSALHGPRLRYIRVPGFYPQSRQRCTRNYTVDMMHSKRNISKYTCVPSASAFIGCSFIVSFGMYRRYCEMKPYF